jgi:hypothetical protein
MPHWWDGFWSAWRHVQVPREIVEIIDLPWKNEMGLGNVLEDSWARHSNADGNLANHAMNRDRLIFVLALSDLWLSSRCDYCC